jgi:multidrug resistance efflux pump
MPTEISNRSQRLTALGGFIVLILYIVWMGWPYLKAIVVRDAAVTTWISVAVSPIAGYTTRPLYPGSHTGPDGRMVTIVDPRADARDLAAARAELMRASARVTAQEMQIAAMHRALEARAGHADQFASTFVRDLDAATTGAKNSLSAGKLRLQLARTEEARVASLHANGLASQAALDTARSTSAELERDIAANQAIVDRATARHHAAADGVFLLEDGTDGNSAFQNLSDARVRQVQATSTLNQVRAERDAARVVLQATEQAFDKSRSLDVTIPPGAMVWSLISGPGAPVQPGSPVASWVDCRVMLVDVALSDVEASLLQPGSPADVVIEGEKTVRRGTVILTRGSAGTLGSTDLAALAKGRHAGLGQALVKLVPSASDVRACAIGHAAFVDFPGVGAFDILRARLRW